MATAYIDEYEKLVIRMSTPSLQSRKMVRISVLNDALKSMHTAEKRGKRQVMIRPSTKVIIKFLMVMQKHGYIGEFEYVDDHRYGKIVVKLNGRLNKCGVISLRFDVGVKELSPGLLGFFHLDMVIIDNGACSNATRVMIDSGRKHGILLEAVQILTDLNLSIKKAYISSDGRWFMDVFHVTDLNGNKLTEKSVLAYIEQSLEKVHFGRSKSFDGLTALELTGTDRVGLLSEVFAVLSDLRCNVVEAKVWTHNGRIASLIYLKDNDLGTPIEDSHKLQVIEGMLRNVLKGDNDIRSAKTSVSLAITHTERRLHQMMFADRDYERKPIINTCDDSPVVSVQNYLERDYSMVYINCKDRNKLLFDVVCTLTDMEYIVFHATVDTSGDRASFEFFIRHMDGSPIRSEAEKERVILCIQAAIQRRASEGVRLELCTTDRKGLLADVMRTFRENGLNITRADISTSTDTALNEFYVTDAIGNQPDPITIESVREKIGLSNLKVKELPVIHQQKEERDVGSGGGAMLLSIGSMVKRNLISLGLIKSYS